MPNLRQSEIRLTVLCILFSAVLFCGVLLTSPISTTLAMPKQSVSAQATVPPQPTAPPPPVVYTQVLDRGDSFDEKDQVGLVVSNNSCLTEPLTVTVGLYNYNPLTSTYPISAPFVAYGGFRQIRVQGVDCSDPICGHTLTTQFWYPTGAQNYRLFYWDPFAREWKWVNQSMAPASYDQYLTTFFNCSNSLPPLTDFGAGVVFAWGYTTTAPSPTVDVFLPIIEQNYSPTP
jgi:hypothetical protein